MINFKLIRNQAGRLVFTENDTSVEHVVPVRAFPIAAPGECISLTDGEGHELAWIEKLSDLPADIRALIAEELA